MTIKQWLIEILKAGTIKIIISNPRSNLEKYKKVIVDKKSNFYQVAAYTEKQVFHQNLEDSQQVVEKCYEIIDGHYRQVNGLSSDCEYILLISKSGECSFKKRQLDTKRTILPNNAIEHNRKKNYIIEEGVQVPPLIDMGIFSKEGKVINSMYDKYKQINRFLELIDDELCNINAKSLNIIDFGCGKSYLTFVVYYYLTCVKGIDAQVVGIDLKSDVVAKCNEAARKYDYKGLNFVVSDINGYEAPFTVDMVLSLHACDTATDYALYNAIKWGAKMIFSVPCCQHELNQQIETNQFSILTRYGIIKERFSALATDAIRGNLLEYSGYKTQLLEFIDFSHTPKNILIRATKRPMQLKSLQTKALEEVKALTHEFGFAPTLAKLLCLQVNEP